MQAGPCIHAGAQLERAGAGPTSGPTRRLAHFGHAALEEEGGGLRGRLEEERGDGVVEQQPALLVPLVAAVVLEDLELERDLG